MDVAADIEMNVVVDFLDYCFVLLNLIVILIDYYFDNNLGYFGQYLLHYCLKEDIDLDSFHYCNMLDYLMY